MSRPYTGFDGWSGGRRIGLEALIRGCQAQSAGAVINNGTYGMRWMRNSSGVLVGQPSVHGTGRAGDLSRRAGYLGHRGCDRRTFERFMDLLVEQADAIGLELVLDYEGGRAWKCDREAWRDWSGGGAGMDWVHVEIDNAHADTVDWCSPFLERVAALFGAPTPPPTPAAVAWPGGRHLKRGTTRADHVRTVQAALNRHGARLAVDGRFGPLTEAAVKAYQRAHPPLAVDGIVGPATWSSLHAH